MSRRFGLLQGSGDGRKVRLIDDFSASLVNQTTQVSTTPKLHTMDVVAAMLLRISEVAPHFQWTGKTVDLSAAYRQLAIHEGSLSHAYIACYNPFSQRAEVYQLLALPFGATASVFSFLRIVHSLWWLGCTALHICWASFFDDFITLGRANEGVVLDGVIKQFFKLLGWEVSGGDKDKPFCTYFKALGVQISFAMWDKQVALLSNTEQRVAELIQTIGDVLSEGRMSKPLAMSLRGRMQFANCQVWGRASKLCLNAVTAHVHNQDSPELTAITRQALRTFAECLQGSRPRQIGSQWNRPWYIFTDASFQPSEPSWPAGLGGLLYNSEGEACSAFSLVLSELHLEQLGYPPKRTVIFECEFLAIILAITLWSSQLSHAPCVIFVDNNAARDVAISGKARSKPADRLVATLLKTEDSISLTPWYARVPSDSNPADSPSRPNNQQFLKIMVPTEVVRTTFERILGM